MEDRRKPRGGPRNTFREDLENWEEEKKQQADPRGGGAEGDRLLSRL